ncbi:MAG: toxin-activating lysine-acyltransferase [Pseudomonadota bacterium]
MAEDEGKAAPRQAATVAEVLGEVVYLMTKPATHKFLFVADLEWLVMPPIMLRQFRLWRQGTTPVAFASWAFLSEEAENRLLAGVRRLPPQEWNSGDRAWLMDILAPDPQFAQRMIEELKQAVFPGRVLKGLKPRENGQGSDVAEL